jgi:hypothetical protein
MSSAAVATKRAPTYVGRAGAEVERIALVPASSSTARRLTERCAIAGVEVHPTASPARDGLRAPGRLRDSGWARRHPAMAGPVTADCK